MKGGEFHLPEPVVHRIQSFLTGKEAAQTTILSKSWHSAWLTRPNLDFDETDFPIINDEFLKFANKTIQRYEQSNLKIERLRLLRRYSSSDIGSYYNPANDFIVRALKIGATHISFQRGNPMSALPLGVFEYGNLVELSEEMFKIDLEMDQKVICSKLESLCLSKVTKKREILYKIISSCPLIKKLSLCNVTFFDYTKGSIDFPELRELRCLFLCKVKFHSLFLADFSSKFPSLEDLTLEHCSNVGEICSRSLKRLTIIEDVYFFEAGFDVPSIQKFTFEGSDYFPSVSFKSTSREWESHVSIDFRKSLSTSWFSDLKRILQHLRTSKIHLSFSFLSDESFNYEPGDIHGLPKPQVENVTMFFCRQLPSLSFYARFDGLFRLCRPKLITHIFLFGNTNNNFLCKTLVRGMNGEFSSPSSFMHSFMHGLHDLEEANMELYDEDVAAWKPMPLQSLMLDGSITTLPKVKQYVRFQLKWKP